MNCALQKKHLIRVLLQAHFLTSVDVFFVTSFAPSCITPRLQTVIMSEILT
jgi:hypothetical protein